VGYGALRSGLVTEGMFTEIPGQEQLPEHPGLARMRRALDKYVRLKTDIHEMAHLPLF
jgi:hypothetical protein